MGDWTQWFVRAKTGIGNQFMVVGKSRLHHIGDDFQRDVDFFEKREKFSGIPVVLIRFKREIVANKHVDDFVSPRVYVQVELRSRQEDLMKRNKLIGQTSLISMLACTHDKSILTMRRVGDFEFCSECMTKWCKKCGEFNREVREIKFYAEHFDTTVIDIGLAIRSPVFEYEFKCAGKQIINEKEIDGENGQTQVIGLDYFSFDE